MVNVEVAVPLTISMSTCSSLSSFHFLFVGAISFYLCFVILLTGIPFDFAPVDCCGGNACKSPVDMGLLLFMLSFSYPSFVFVVEQLRLGVAYYFKNRGLF